MSLTHCLYSSSKTKAQLSLPMRNSLFAMLLVASSGLSAQTTFNVDMTCAPAGFTDVFVTGPWCGWCANDTYNTMTDDDGDGIYSVSVTIDGVALGDLVEYKYAINGFADQENLVNGSDVRRLPLRQPSNSCGDTVTSYGHVEPAMTGPRSAAGDSK